MFLSRVEINPYRHETIKALSSPQILHAAIMASFSSFGERPGRVMWRVDSVGSSTYIIVQSDTRPDFNHIIDQFGRPASDYKWDVLDYDEFLSRLEKGQVWRFRLKANPTYSLPSSDGKRGKVVAHVTAEQQMSWLIKKSNKCGFSVYEDSAIIKYRDIKTFEHGNSKITLATAIFEGILVVDDADLLRRYIIDGIGRGKAYGCGLLTLARV